MDGGSRGGGGGLAAAATTNAGLNPNTPPPFLSKTYDMVDDPATDAVISWGPHNNSFVVWDQSEFARDLLPKYFKHSNFSSFVRQLNTYGFRKVDHDRFEFANEGFLKGQKHLLKNIIRRKLSHPHSQAQEPQTQNAPVAICIEVGNFGIEEEIERLKRDKNILMQELIRLRQQQQTADHQLQTLGKRLQGMERQQQLMMSFLAKAMQSPGLFAQLVQQNENNRHVAGVKKKRRLPRQESSSLEEKCASPDGQIIKYQPLMNDSTTAMLAQMLSFDPSSRLEEPLNNSDGLLVDNFPSPPEALKGSSSLDQNCAVTHAEVPQNPDVPPFFPVSSSFSTACSSSTASNEIQSEAGIADITMAGVLQDTSMLSPAPVAISCEFPEMQGMVPDESVGDVPIENFVVPKGESMYLNEIATGVDGSMPTEETVDDQKLSEIMHSLLEEFIAASPQTGETQEMVKSTEEAVEMQQPASGSKWENARNMDNLTGQMASDSKV